MRKLLLQLSLVTLLIVISGLAVKPIRLNLAHLQLNRLIFSSPSTLQTYATLLEQTGMLYSQIEGENNQNPEIFERTCTSGGSSLIAWLMAIQSRYKQDFAQTGEWLLLAAKDFPESQAALPVMLPEHAVPSAESGDIDLLWDGTYWERRRDALPIEVQVDQATQILTLSYENRPLTEDRFVYQWHGAMTLPYWHSFQVVSRLSKGAFLTLEVHSENGLKRYVSYQEGSGEWQAFRLPFEGTELRHIYIMVTDSANNPSDSQYQLQLMPVKILMDPELQTCALVQ